MWDKYLRPLCWSVLFWGLLLFFFSSKEDFLDPIRNGMLLNLHELVKNDWYGIRAVLTILSLVLVWFSAIAVHEVGHALTGVAVGFRLKYLQIGNTKIDRSLRVTRMPHSTGRRIGAAAFYAEELKNRPGRYAVMILAGPLSNLIAAGVFAVLPFEKSIISGMFILICLYQGLGNMGPWASDGRKLLTILVRQKVHEAGIALAQLSEEIQAGREYTELDHLLVAEAARLRERSILTPVAHAIAYAVHYESRDYAAAASSLELCLAYSPWATKSMRNALYCDATILQAKMGRLELAETWFAEIPVNTKLTFRLEAEAAIQEARGHLMVAIDKITESENQLLQEATTKRTFSHLRKLREWKNEIGERLATALK